MFFSTNVNYNKSTYDKQNAIIQYEKNRDINKLYLDIIDGKDVQVPENVTLIPLDKKNRKTYLKEYLMYDFLLNSNTFSSDYINIDDLSSSNNNHIKALSQLNFANYSFYLFVIIAIIFSISVMSADFVKGKAKLIFSTSIKREDVFAGKLFFLSLVIIVFFIIAFIFGLLFNYKISENLVLVFKNENIVTVNSFRFYFAKMIANLLIMFFVSTFCILAINLTKRIGGGIIIFIGFYLLNSLLLLCINKYSYLNAQVLSNYLQIINVQVMKLEFADIWFWIMLIIYKFEICIMLKFSNKLFKKCEF